LVTTLGHITGMVSCILCTDVSCIPVLSLVQLAEFLANTCFALKAANRDDIIPVAVIQTLTNIVFGWGFSSSKGMNWSLYESGDITARFSYILVAGLFTLLCAVWLKMKPITYLMHQLALYLKRFACDLCTRRPCRALLPEDRGEVKWYCFVLH
jgi:hypothetical protein